jgi:allophanate hydrolase subunit 1
VAAGSVAIAASQTAVYPLDTPGGWHIIGTTSTVMFDPTRDPPALLAAGDSVRFEPVR